VIELTFASYCPEADSIHDSARFWAEEMEKRSGGRVKATKWLWAGALLKGDTMTPGIASGMADWGFVACAYNPANWPLNTAADILWLTDTPGAKALVMLDLYETYAPLREEFRRNNLVPAIWNVVDATCLAGTGKPVKTLDDLQGRRIRAYGIVNEAMALLDAVPVAMSAADIYTGLEKGTIDGFCGINVCSLIPSNYHEVVDWMMDPGMGMYVSSATFMNLDTWNSFPDDIKKISEDISRDFVKAQVPQIGDLIRDTLRFYIDAGVEVYSLSDAEKARWRAKANPEEKLWKEWFDKREELGAPVREYMTLFRERLQEAEATEWIRASFPGQAELFKEVLAEYGK